MSGASQIGRSDESESKKDRYRDDIENNATLELILIELRRIRDHLEIMTGDTFVG